MSSEAAKVSPLGLWRWFLRAAAKNACPWLEVCLSCVSEETEQIPLRFQHCLRAPLRGIYCSPSTSYAPRRNPLKFRRRDYASTSHLAAIRLTSWLLATFRSPNGVLHSLLRTSWTLIMRFKEKEGKKQDWKGRQHTDDLVDGFWCGICHALSVNELKILPLSDNIKRGWNIQSNSISHKEYESENGTVWVF